MDEKIIKVFFAADLLPYKDKELQVHAPVQGRGAFLGASNTTKIRFYFDKIGDLSTTWVSIAKLPNGKQGSKVLPISSDEDGNYAELSLSNWYTQAKGDVFIALQGYQGGVEYSYDSETELYEIHGTPTIQTTGCINLSINYAPTGDSPDYNDEFSTYQEILAALGDKLNITSGIVVVSDIDGVIATNYSEGQLLYDVSEKALYRVESGEFELFFKTYDKDYLDNEFADIRSKLETNPLPSYDLDTLLYHGASPFSYYPISYFATEYPEILGKAIILKVQSETFIALIKNGGSTGTYTFGLVELGNDNNRRTGLNVSGSTYWSKIMHDSYYQHNYELSERKVTSIGVDSTNTQYPSAKAVYDSEQALNQVLQTNINASGHSIVATIDNSTYVLTITLKDANGNTLGTAQQVDLPLESIIVSGTYDDTTEKIILTMKDGNTIEIPVHDLVDGLVDTTTFNTELAKKADKIGALPRFTDIGTENIITFITNNNLSGVPFIFDNHFAIFSSQYSTFYTFEIETLGTTNRYYGGSVNLSGLTFNDIINSTTYRDNYMLTKSVLPSFHVASTDNVYNFLTVPPYDQHLNQPMILYIGDVPYFASFNDYAPSGHYIYTSFELEACDNGAGSNRYAGQFTDKTNTTFADLISSSRLNNYELERRKVSSWQSTPTDTNYPSEKLVKDSLDAKQNTLVSGTNIKTINNESILGSGNINIQGGSGATWGQITGTLSDQTDLNNELKDIREVAEGKTKSYVLNYEITTAYLKDQSKIVYDLVSYTQFNYETQKLETKKFTSQQEMEDWIDSHYLVNSLFNNSSNSISVPVITFEQSGYKQSFIAVRTTGVGEENINNSWLFYVIYNFEEQIGSPVFVEQLNVPDRWFSYIDYPVGENPVAVFNALEAKTDLSNYATTTQLATKSDLSNIAPAYSSYNTYTIGEVVEHEGKIYKCTTAITTVESWDSTHWTEISVASDFVNLTGTQVVEGHKTFKAIDKMNENASGYGLTLPSTTSLTANSELVDTANAQTISADKILNNASLRFTKDGQSSSQGISASSRYVMQIYAEQGIVLRTDNGHNVRPYSNNRSSLGNSSYKWVDLFLSGVISDGTNSVSVADISNGLVNVINASDIASNNQLTQAQYDLITNGKMTLIVGSFAGLTNPKIINANISGSETFITIIGSYTNAYSDIVMFKITNSTRIISTTREAEVRFRYNNSLEINPTYLKILGKSIPNYPTTNTSPQYIQIGASGGSLSWNDPFTPTSISLSDGGTISDTTLQKNIQYHRPIVLNGFTCYFSCDDGTNYQYVSTRYDSSANKNHINVITINKSTWVATFHTSDLALS